MIGSEKREVIMALGALRRHKRWLYVFLWVVILGFIVFYIPAFQSEDSTGRAQTVARVGGLSISVSEFQRAYLEQRQQLERMYQGRIDPRMMRRLGLEEQVLQRLVADRLVLLEARRLGLKVADDALAQEIARQPGLQEDGRFVGTAEYRRRLEMQGRSPEEFEEGFRSELLRRQLETLVTSGVSVSSAEAETEFRRRNEQVRLEYVMVGSDRVQREAPISDDEVKGRFEAAKERYRIPEKRTLSYLLLDRAATQTRITVTDRDIEVYYDEHRDEFRQEEQVCASHILVKVKETAEVNEGHSEAEAKSLAENILSKLKNGADFAGLAKKSSEDTGSASKGGDLGCFQRGSMVPEFENVAFGLDPGKTSELVKSSHGFHIIRVASRREESVRPLIEVKEGIRQSLLGERTEAFIEEKAAAISAQLRQKKSLDQAGKEHGLSVQTTTPFAKGDVPEALRSPALSTRAFVLKPQETDPEALAVPRGYAFIALAEVKPSFLPELKDVAERVKADVAQEKALAQARTVAEEIRSRAEKVGLEKAATEKGLVRKETPALVGRGQPMADLGSSLALEEAVFALPERTLSEPIRVRSGYAVLRVLEKKAFDPVAFEKEKGSLMAALREERRRELFVAYMGEARRRFPVERNAETYRRVVSR